MSDFPFRAIGFDLDGTLLDSFRDLGAAVNHALALGGFQPAPLESSKDLIGGGAKIMLARAVEEQGGMPESDFRALYKAMLEYYEAHNAVHTVPYAHVRDGLHDLAARGMTMAVVTNKFEGFARSILTQLDLIDLFVAVIGGDSMGKGEDGQFLAKPHPAPIIEAMARCGVTDPAHFAFLGDSTYDVRAAKAAGVPVIAAAYGYCDRPAQELGADAVIDSFDALVPTLEALSAAS
jgi:phosphoglycolate phosphatase